jgi:hypothetical protein
MWGYSIFLYKTKQSLEDWNQTHCFLCGINAYLPAQVEVNLLITLPDGQSEL